MKAKLVIEMHRPTEGLKYSPQTGIIYRSKPTTEGTRSKCLPIMGKNGRGYKCIYVKRRLWRQHRLAFYFMGFDIKSSDYVDHINGCVSDNRWSNLRIVSKIQNSLNRISHRNGKYPYIKKRNDCDRYEVSIPIGTKRYYIGCYKNINDAIESRNEFLTENYPHILNEINGLEEMPE